MPRILFCVGNIKGIGRIYQQTFVDTYSRVAICKLYTEKTAITAADMLNDRVVPFFERVLFKVCQVRFHISILLGKWISISEMVRAQLLIG
jgi:hypothetical protein